MKFKTRVAAVITSITLLGSIGLTGIVAAKPIDFCIQHPRNPNCVVVPTPTPTVTPTPRPSPSPSPTPVNGWTTVVNDQFDNSTTIPTHWTLYNGPYGSNAHNCAAPSQDFVSGGYLHLLMSYLSTGKCGAAWYTGGMRLDGFSTIDQRVTLRYRIVDSGVSAHYVIPMRWPDLDSSWPAGGEEDYCEGDVTTSCSSYLHYGSTNQQVSHAYTVDLSQWHTLSFARLNHVVTATIDGAVVWTYNGSSTTLPDTLKHVVLQQECHGTGCPSGTTGSSEIQVDWITVENPSGTPTPTPTATPSPTPTVVPTPTPTATPSPTPTITPRPSITPAPSPSGTPGSVTVVAVGDIHGEGSDADSIATANAVDAINPAAILGLGDYQYTTGTCANFMTAGRYNSDWGRETYRMYDTLGPTHDYDASTANAAGYFSGQCSGQSTKSAGALLLGGTQVWNQPYSFNVGNWHIIQLPSLCYRFSGCDATAISTWLNNDLTADTHTCQLAYWHEPYWTSPSSEHTRDTSMKAWTQILFNHGADLILNGHQHFYERFFPQNMSDVRDDAHGIAEIIAGTGGIGFYSKLSTAANEAAYQSGTFGVLKLTLSSTSYTTQFVPVEGGTYNDSSSGTCH